MAELKNSTEQATPERQSFSPSIFRWACVVIGILTAFFGLPDGKAEHQLLTLKVCFVGVIAGSLVGGVFAGASHLVYKKFGANGRTLFLSAAMIAVICLGIWVRACLAD